MEKLFGYSTVVIEPMFRITPESFNAVNVVPSLGLSFVFTDYHVVAPKPQGSVCIPIIGIVETPWLSMTADQLSDNPIVSFRNGEDTDDPISLENPQDYDLSSSSPSSFSWPFTAECRLITLDFTTERFSAFFSNAQYLADRTEEALSCFPRSWTPEPESICRDAEHEVFQEFLFSSFWKTTAGPCALECISILAAPTFESTVLQYPGPSVSASWTSSSHIIFILTAIWSGLRGHYLN